jgi:flagellar biosynthesis protein FlhF
MGQKTYRGKTMKEALAQVRKDLGGDAVIIASREVRRRRLFGLAHRQLIEVTASATMPPRESVEEGSSLEGRFGERSTAPVTKTSQIRRGDAMSLLPAMDPTPDQAGRLGALFGDLPPELFASYAQLVDNDVPEILARRLIRSLAHRLEPDQAGDPRAIQEALVETVGQCIPIAPPCRAVPGTRRIVALVGPTGVGKTTTVAKLAASFKVMQGLRTGLVTLDTYRIAAVDQLKTYAEIIDLPLAVANDPGQVSQAISALGAVDIVFIDTAGRSPRDEPRIRELDAFMARSRPDEVHLVLNAGASERTLRSAVERFAQVRADRLIWAKVDEAPSLGAVLSVLGQANLPVSYLTTGQDVPDDIEAADRKRLARLVLGWEVVR